MPENKPAKKINRESFIEKLIRRVLETLGGGVDSLFGRGKKSDALPSTGDLSERLRKLIDARAQISKDGRKLAPHLIRLKYAWGQSTDEFLAALKRLQNEMLVVAIDHINDNRYTTLAPVKINSKADILSAGFTLSVGFDETDAANSEQVEVPAEIYAKLLPQVAAAPKSNEITVNTTVKLPNGREKDTVLRFVPNGKNLIVGRIKECDLYLDDNSVSKHHASLVMNGKGIIRVADIGSTNGTFVSGERIAYGKAYEIKSETTVGFGDVMARLVWELPASEPEISEQEQTPLEIGVTTTERAHEIVETKAIIAPEVEQETELNAKVKDKLKTFVVEKAEDDESNTFVREKVENDEFKTFVPEEVESDEKKTFVIEEKPEDEFKTFIVEDQTDDKKTFVMEEAELKDEPKIVNQNFAAPETVADSSIQQPKELIPENEDFSQSAGASLVGFDSLLGKSAGQPEKQTPNSDSTDKYSNLPD